MVEEVGSGDGGNYIQPEARKLERRWNEYRNKVSRSNTLDKRGLKGQRFGDRESESEQMEIRLLGRS